MKNKKKLSSVIAVLIIVVVMALNINFSANKSGLSDLVLANVEALAIGEHPLDEGCKLVDPHFFYDGCYWDKYSCPDGKYRLVGPQTCIAK